MSISFFVGKNGHGKTAALVEHGVIPCWEAGRAVVSNISLYPEELGFPSEFYIPLNDPLEQLPRLGRHVKRLCVECRARVRLDVCRRCCSSNVLEVPRMHPDGSLWSITGNEGVGLVLDEITAMFPARDAVSLPPELQRLLNQFRKPDIAPVLISAPAWARADLMIRETCTAVVESEPWLERLGPFWLLSKKPATPWGWPEHRAFVRSWWDPLEYERADMTMRWDLVAPTRVKRSFRPSTRRRVQAAYDTHEGVELADHISCGVCGGKTSRGVCKDRGGHAEWTKNNRRQIELTQYPIPGEEPAPEELQPPGKVGPPVLRRAG